MRTLAYLPLLLLAACSSENKSAGGVTPDEARALDDAAEMLDGQRLPADAVPAGQAPAQPQPASSAAPRPKPPAKPAVKPAG